MPKRIQRRRTRGWRMPEGAIYVGRPTKWGNPYLVGPYSQKGAVWRYADLIDMCAGFGTPYAIEDMARAAIEEQERAEK